jgi:hypothetical protein
LKLLAELRAIVRQIESALDLRLKDQDFAHGQEEILHVFLHEACHAAVCHAVPWIHDLDERAHTALDEILARLLEEEIGLALGLFVHTPEEPVRELARYPVAITVEQYEHLHRRWRQHYWPGRDVEGLATYALGYLRREGVTGA